MVWIYLAESAAYPLPCHNGSDQLPTAKSTPIVREYFYLNLKMVDCIVPQFGMIYEPLPFMEPEISWIFSTVASPARGSALQDLEKAWQMSEADYFSRSCAWPKKSSQSLYFWKTSPLYPQEVGYESLEKLPKWGMIVGGVLYPLLPLEHHTKEIGGSYWPTPCARDWKDSGMEPSGKRRHTPGLPVAVHMFPAPDAGAIGAGKNQNGHHFTILNAVGSGKLNPIFVEWLMGYGEGWTELSAWAIQWFLSKRKKRSKC